MAKTMKTSERLSISSEGVGGHRYPESILGDFQILLEPGEIAAIMAPSGSGKTTLLNALAGLKTPANLTISREPNSVAYSFQDDRLLPWKTIRRNISLAEADPSPVHGQRPDRISTLLKCLRLDPSVEESFPRELSGGMRKRVSIARALYAEAEVLLLDEALSGLDASVAMDVASLIVNSVKSEGMISLLTSHSPVHVALLSSKVYIMDGPPLRIVDQVTVGDPADPRVSDGKFAEVVDRLFKLTIALGN